MAKKIWERSGSVTECVTNAEVKKQLELPSSFTSDDTKIDGLISAARDMCELWIGRCLVDQTIKYYPSKWPDDRRFVLPQPILKSFTSFEYVDRDGATQTLATSKFYEDTKCVPGAVILKETETLPKIHQHQPNPITITYQAGWDDADSVPDLLKQGIIEHAAEMYVNRIPVHISRDGRVVSQLPVPFQRLYGPYKVRM